MPVLTEKLFGAEGLSSHWAVVIGIGAAFLLVQMALSLRLYLRAGRHNRTLLAMYRELQRSGDGRRTFDRSLERFDWLSWVLSVFPAEGSSARSAFTRDEALEELDTRMTSDSSYLLLQRMGIMAPLLGVVLTVIGFYWLEVDDAGEQSLQTILTAVTPLVSGVGAGAILALFNQVLLQLVGSRMEQLRMTARSWFDAAIWSHANVDDQTTKNNALAAIQQFAATLSAVAEQHAASTEQIGASTASMKQASSQFEEVVRSFHREIKGIPQALCVLRDATAASANALQELLPVGVRALSSLDVSVAAFRSTIEREFTEAARLQYRAGKALASSVGQISDSTDSLKSRTDEMREAAAASAAALQKVDDSLLGAAKGLVATTETLRRTMESEVAPSQQALHGAAHSFAQSADTLSAFIGDGLSPAARELASLHETLAGMASAVRSIQNFAHARGDIDRLTDTLSRAAEITDAIAALPEQIRGVMEQVMVQTADASSARSRKNWLIGRPR